MSEFAPAGTGGAPAGGDHASDVTPQTDGARAILVEPASVTSQDEPA